MEFHAYVDGSYHQNLVAAGYGVVVVDEQKNVLKKYNGIINTSKLTPMRQIGGEIIAATVAVRLGYLEGCDTIHLYYDLEGTFGWANLNKPWETTRVGTQAYQDFMHYMQEEKGIKIKFHKVFGSHSKSTKHKRNGDKLDPLNDLADEVAKQSFSRVEALECMKGEEIDETIISNLFGMEIFDIETIEENLFNQISNNNK